MYRVTKIKAMDPYRLFIEFEDGKSGEIDLTDRLFGPVFEPLRNLAIFAQAHIDKFGVICWPNGADLAPDALYKQLEKIGQDASALGGR